MAGDSIRIDDQLCTGCGQCVEVCLGKILAQENGEVRAVRSEWCSQCGHCTAICPVGAIAVGEDRPVPFSAAPGVTPDQMLDAIRARRSIRHYRPEPVGRELLDRLIEAARYAPTGSNMQSTCFTVITNPAKMEQIRKGVLAGLEARVQLLESLAEAHEKEGKPIPEEHRVRFAVRDRYRNMLDMAKTGQDVLFHGAPAAVLVHGDPVGITPKDDADLMAMCMLLMAHSMGLGTCLLGLLTAAMAGDPKLRALAELPEGHQVLTSFVVGRPRLEFQRAPGRKPARVRWL